MSCIASTPAAATVLKHSHREWDSPAFPLPWIQAARNAPYFIDENGQDWTPIGHNDALTWPSLSGLLKSDISGVDVYLKKLATHGVTCLRVMLEYAQSSKAIFEGRLGRFRPSMISTWDNLFRLCAQHRIRILLTPYDTFWMWRRWNWHPYNRKNGGPLEHPSRILLCRETREAIKGRLRFAVERWGGSGALFGWDLWNEIHPGQAEDRIDCFEEFIADLSTHVRQHEIRLYGRSHPQTVSLFGPEIDWRPHLDFTPSIFRHANLDFATIHIYREGTIDDPRDTVAPALDMAAIVGRSLNEITDARPFLDSEHGPIHRFKDHRQTLGQEFDDEYFRHMQWAHLAAGAAGGGMRWPNRHPHVLTEGMHRAQRALSGFLPLIEWKNFQRENWTSRIKLSAASVRAVGCGDARQAVLWLVRKGPFRGGMLQDNDSLVNVSVTVPGLSSGRYDVTCWDTWAGRQIKSTKMSVANEPLQMDVELRTDLALAIRAT